MEGERRWWRRAENGGDGRGGGGRRRHGAPVDYCWSLVGGGGIGSARGGGRWGFPVLVVIVRAVEEARGRIGLVHVGFFRVPWASWASLLCLTI